MTDKKGRPGLAELNAWAHDDITIWVLKQLHHKFPPYEDLLPVKSQDQIFLLNYRVGSWDVLDSIAKLIKHGEC